MSAVLGVEVVVLALVAGWLIGLLSWGWWQYWGGQELWDWLIRR